MMDKDPFEDFLTENLSAPDLELTSDMHARLFKAAGLTVGAGVAAVAASKSVGAAAEPSAPALFDWVLGEHPISPEVVKHLSSSPEAAAEVKSDISFLRQLRESLRPAAQASVSRPWSHWLALAATVTILGILAVLMQKGVGHFSMPNFAWSKSVSKPGNRPGPMPSSQKTTPSVPAVAAGNPQVGAITEPVVPPQEGFASSSSGQDSPRDPWGNNLSKNDADGSPIKDSSDQLKKLLGLRNDRLFSNDYAGGLSIASSGSGQKSRNSESGEGAGAIASAGSSFSALAMYQDSFGGNTTNGVTNKPLVSVQIPEPTVVVLALLGSMSLLVRRRRD